MSLRTAVMDFSLANAMYINAIVYFYTVDVNGEKTTTLAKLYADSTSAEALPNPQVLDSYGKFKVPVYIDVAVIASVTGIGNAPEHDTGIIRPAEDVTILLGDQTGVIVDKTASFSISNSESGKGFTNKGATVGIIGALPPATVVGAKFGFFVHAAFNYRITASVADKIRNGTSLTASGGNIVTNAVGAFAKLECIVLNEWWTIDIMGEWTPT
jgi:hypothetical protein